MDAVLDRLLLIGMPEFGRQVTYSCGVIHDRDRNVAINLMKFAASFALIACERAACRKGLASVLWLA